MEEGPAQPFMKSKSQVKNVQDQARSVLDQARSV